MVYNIAAMENDLKELELLLAIDENTVETVRNIRQAKKELETTFDSITDVVLLVNVDGNIIRGNRAIGVWTSREVTKIEGLFFHDLFHPGCHDAKCHMISYWHLAREKIHNKKAFEYQIMDRLLNRFLLVQFRPISQEKTGTRKNFAVVTFKDITQNKQAQVQLDQTTAELSTIFKVLPDQYIRLNWDGTILDLRVNRNSKSSVLPMESAGNRIQDCFPQKVGEKFRQAITEVLQKRSKVVVEYSLLIDKAEEFFEARLLPLLQNNIIVINRNITENKRLESIAESVDMMKNLGYIFSGIRHEIGNPINAIKMTMSVLKKNISVFSKAKVLEYADRALTEINRVEYLLKSFKNFNMFETLDIEAIDIV
ncbi:MAG: PAS domain-containing protein, partial [bacterium]|nr:PAS domain-containing protein [bacterium]